jgi:RNA polymerase sigma-70 factor (ECF subfamily)
MRPEPSPASLRDLSPASLRDLSPAGRDSSLASLRELADEDLVHVVRGGDAAAFEVLYERHATAAFSLAYRMMGTRPGAEDVLQEAFLSMWRSNARYDRGRGSVRTWILGIVHNRAIDALRRSAPYERLRASDEGIGERFEAPERTEAEAARLVEADEVREALETLPADQSQVIELAYFGGFSHSEIADMLDTPIGTVKGRMRLGLQKMRGRLSGPAEAYG